MRQRQPSVKEKRAKYGSTDAKDDPLIKTQAKMFINATNTPKAPSK